MREHRAGCSRAALRNVPPPFSPPCPPPVTADEVFSVSVELRRPLCALHPEHILRDERGYGFEETKRLARDKRICFTATARRAGDEGRGEDEI